MARQMRRRLELGRQIESTYRCTCELLGEHRNSFKQVDIQKRTRKHGARVIVRVDNVDADPGGGAIPD